ncbi:redox-regulated ATPase YchF [Chitinispirillales bacterium ANBcel5]|uniref:redox-regulated ATPase YchF n=1 Tax=Cellulosispirillum alkaliphilum TaxID=3039283 RepID=UPI002A4E81EA|nr:redox-regulated ATPase YchF [Chitinispirillales bacterium ANBcel5]
MGLAAGIIGLPNVGKSTIFNALCSGSGKAQAENYPFCTIDPNHGIIAVPDERLKSITEFIPTQKVIPAFLELIDIAGLVRGASKGEGLGNQFLGHIKDVDAVAHVVRCFETGDVVHVDGSVDPLRDINTIETELMIKDLDTVERGVTRVERAAKSGDKEMKRKLEIFKKVESKLSEGVAVREALQSAEEMEAIAELHLLSAKPVLYVANVDEQELHEDNESVKKLKAHARSVGAECIKISGKVESEIAELNEDDRKEFLESLGLEEPGLNTLAKSIYKLLGLRTFFTAGEKENRAWTMLAGSTAPQAAGVIHSDFEKGFIRADVYTLEDLQNYKTEANIKAAGKVRSEGKEYVVKDGDIVFFKFNV